MYFSLRCRISLFGFKQIVKSFFDYIRRAMPGEMRILTGKEP